MLVLYSTRGLLYGLYSSVYVRRLLAENDRRIMLLNLDALELMCVLWVLHFKLSDMRNPRSFTTVVVFAGTPLTI